jgi:hypothetical protein
MGTRDGSAKSFSHSHSHFRPSPSHRTAFASHFSHFRTFLIFLLHVSHLLHQKVEQSAKKCEKKCEKSAKNAKKCEKVRNANAMRKWNQNSHRIASHYYRKKIRIFALFRIAFASHYHP